MTPIDLTQFTGHTPGPWHDRAPEHKAQYYSVGAMQTDVHGTYPIAHLANGTEADKRGESQANATLIAAAPDMKDEIIELRGEVHQLTKALDEPKAHLWTELKNERNRRDALTATNNNLVDTVRELRGKVEMLQGELRDAHTHAATLAGALENVLEDYVVDTEDGTRDNDVVQSLYDQRRETIAALAAYHKATGGDNNAR